MVQLNSFSKNFIALLVGICLVLVFDLSLALFGIVPLSSEDSLVGFSGSSPLFVASGDSADGKLYERNPAKERYFNSQTFQCPKPQGKFRVVSFGGSTTYGRPFLDKTSFSNWFKDLLIRYGENSDVETINTGGISYASYRVQRVMQEMVEYQPDLFVVYSGHNEFLEARTFAAQKEESESISVVRSLLHRSRLYTLVKKGIDSINRKELKKGVSLLGDEVTAQLEQVGGPELYHRDPTFRASVIAQYRDSIETMVVLARDSGTPLILCTLPSNLSGLSPFKSEHRSGLTDAEWRQWQASYDKGLHAVREQSWSLAVEAFLAAEKIDAEYASLHYYKGQALEQLGQKERSYQSYLRAKQEDIVPLRALEEFNQILREIAREQNVPLADVDRFMRNVSPSGIPGSNLFVDHVHPYIEGQQMIAWVVLNTAVNAGLVPLSGAEWQASQIEARDFLRAENQTILPRYRAMGVWGVGRLFYWAGKSAEAYVALHEAWQTVKDVPEIPRKLGLLEVERGNGVAALEYFAAAEKMEPDHPWALLGMATAYNLIGEWDEALASLERLPEGREREPGYHSARGQALIGLGRNDEGFYALEQAVRLAPDLPRGELDLAVALGNVGKKTVAGEHFQNYLKLRQLPVSREIIEEWLQQFD